MLQDLQTIPYFGSRNKAKADQWANQVDPAIRTKRGTFAIEIHSFLTFNQP
jgi:hypothetical protein